MKSHWLALHARLVLTGSVSERYLLEQATQHSRMYLVSTINLRCYAAGTTYCSHTMSEVMFCWQTIFVAADSCMISSHIFRSSDPTCAFLAIDVFVQFRASFNLDGCDSAFTITYIAIVIYRILCILSLQFCIDYLLV